MQLSAETSQEKLSEQTVISESLKKMKVKEVIYLTGNVSIYLKVNPDQRVHKLQYNRSYTIFLQIVICTLDMGSSSFLSAPSRRGLCSKALKISTEKRELQPKKLKITWDPKILGIASSGRAQHRESMVGSTRI